jgi:hypothetical protein
MKPTETESKKLSRSVANQVNLSQTSGDSYQ